VPNHVRSLRLIASLAIIVITLAACGRTDAPLSPIGTIVTGTWGASDVQLIAVDSATLVRVGCDDGQFTGHLTLDADGAFTANGTWTQGFQAGFYFPHPVPAQLTGQVTGTRLTFAVAAANSDGKPVISTGPRTVALGAPSPWAVCGV
jgi:hypothetical protein